MAAPCSCAERDDAVCGLAGLGTVALPGPCGASGLVAIGQLTPEQLGGAPPHDLASWTGGCRMDLLNVLLVRTPCLPLTLISFLCLYLPFLLTLHCVVDSTLNPSLQLEGHLVIISTGILSLI